MFCCVLQFPAWWPRLEWLTKENVVVNDGKRGEVRAREEEVFLMDQMPSFCTLTFRCYEQNPWSTRLNCTSVVEQTIDFW